MSTRIETRMRASISPWARAGLALVALAGLAALLLVRPAVPAMPWQPLQPTTNELAREAVLFVVWLVLVATCVRFAWLAMKPPRRLETTSYEPPGWLPQRRRAQLVPARSQSRELVRLFSGPKRIDVSEVGLGTRASNARELAGVKNAREASDGGDAQIAVSLVGRLRIGAGDGEGASERATRGLIAYLVLKRAPATMDELVEALWPGESPVKTRQRLWKAKRQAQRLLGETLVRHHDGYVLDRARLRTDLDELDALRRTEPLGREDLERAAALTQEEPFADIDYTWIDGERRRLQAIQGELLERLAEARLAEGDANGALAAAERLIQLDRLNERGWCLAMEAEGELGNRQGILDRYALLRSELDERLGLRPRGETKETYRRLLAQT